MKKSAAPHVLIKWRKAQHATHHCGSWKIAYADFMTAMMAFFLVMWLLSSTTPQERMQIADYFKMPIKEALTQGNKFSMSESPIPGGGENVIRQDGEQQKRRREADRQRDIQGLKKTRYRLEQLLRNDPRLRELQPNMLITLVQEGLRIEIIDSQKRPMFITGSKEVEPYMRDILHIIAPVLNEIPNQISLAGHTDNQPYINGERGYGNWELSTDRANAARREMVEGGLSADKILRVTGMANTMAVQGRPGDADALRRISIVILTKEQEAAIRKENASGNAAVLGDEPDEIPERLKQLTVPHSPTMPGAQQEKSSPALSPSNGSAPASAPSLPAESATSW